MKLSIIVPVYNAEKYLDKTISNIFKQTFTDYELILIDDGSKDNSGNICEEWRKKDNRIKVIHQDNTGVGGARNAGLDIAQGEYIGFVDNDDFIHPQMYEILIGIAEKENADIVMSVEKKADFDWKVEFDYINVSSVAYELLCQDKIYCNMYSKGVNDGPYMAIWNKVYKKDIIGNTRYPLIGSEDTVFNSRLYYKVHTFALIDSNVSLYFWVQRDTSQFHDIFSGYKSNMLKSYFTMSFELYENAPEYVHYCLEKTMKRVLSTRYLYGKTEFKHEVESDIKGSFREFKELFIYNRQILLSSKMLLLLFYYFPFSYKVFRKIMDK